LAEEIRWAMIRVPVEVRDRLLSVARKERRGIWRVINDAMDLYEVHRPKSREEFKFWEGASRYIVKLVVHVGVLKARPSKLSLEQLRKVCEWIEEELGVKTEQLVKAAEAYMKGPTDDNAAELISTAKMTAIEILYRYHELMRKRGGGELESERRGEGGERGGKRVEH